MLGRPEVDPHGDPIPERGGHRQAAGRAEPAHLPAADAGHGDAGDRSGHGVPAIHRAEQPEAGRVDRGRGARRGVRQRRVRGKDDRRITIGARAASKLLVEVAGAVLLLPAWRQRVAQDRHDPLPSPTPRARRPFEITDNSFLVEEAFNQEAGIFQNIVGVLRSPATAPGSSAFTQEWPVACRSTSFPTRWHSPTPMATTGIGDVLLNYRYQLVGRTARRPAFSPRVSLVIPTGGVRRGLGSGSSGWQFNLPVSKQVGDFYLHGNAGVTHLPSAEVDGGPARPVHAACRRERNLARAADVQPDARKRRRRGARKSMAPSDRRGPALHQSRRDSATGWNIGDAQAIVGLALPVTFHGRRHRRRRLRLLLVRTAVSCALGSPPCTVQGPGRQTRVTRTGQVDQFFRRVLVAPLAAASAIGQLCVAEAERTRQQRRRARTAVSYRS